MADDFDFFAGRKEPENPTWTDYGRAAYSGVQQLSSAAQSGLAYTADKLGEEDAANDIRDRGRLVREDTERNLREMSPVARERLQSGPLDSTFWEHPFSAVALKSAQMAPAIVVGALPGGVIGEVLGAGEAGLIGTDLIAAQRMTAAGATAGAAGTNALIGSGQFIDAVASRVGALDDDALKGESSYYAGLRTRMNEVDARKQFETYLTEGNGALALNALAAGIAGGAGLPGMLARGGAGAISGSIGRRAMIGAAEGGLPNALQSGVADYTEQNAAMTGGMQNGFDPHEWTSAVLEGLGLGAIPGAAHGMWHKGPGAPPAPVRDVDPNLFGTRPPPPRDIESAFNQTSTAAASTGVAPKTARATTQPPPNEAAQAGEIGNTTNPPTRDQEPGTAKEAATGVGPAGQKIKSKKGRSKATVPEVEALAPDPAQAAALPEAAQPATVDLSAFRVPPEPVPGPEPLQRQELPDAPASEQIRQAQSRLNDVASQLPPEEAVRADLDNAAADARATAGFKESEPLSDEEAYARDVKLWGKDRADKLRKPQPINEAMAPLVERDNAAPPVTPPSNEAPPAATPKKVKAEKPKTPLQEMRAKLTSGERTIARMGKEGVDVPKKAPPPKGFSKWVDKDGNVWFYHGDEFTKPEVKATVEAGHGDKLHEAGKRIDEMPESVSEFDEAAARAEATAEHADLMKRVEEARKEGKAAHLPLPLEDHVKQSVKAARAEWERSQKVVDENKAREERIAKNETPEAEPGTGRFGDEEDVKNRNRIKKQEDNRAKSDELFAKTKLPDAAAAMRFTQKGKQAVVARVKQIMADAAGLQIVDKPAYEKHSAGQVFLKEAQLFNRAIDEAAKKGELPSLEQFNRFATAEGYLRDGAEGYKSYVEWRRSENEREFGKGTQDIEHGPGKKAGARPIDEDQRDNPLAGSADTFTGDDVVRSSEDSRAGDVFEMAATDKASDVSPDEMSERNREIVARNLGLRTETKPKVELKGDEGTGFANKAGDVGTKIKVETVKRRSPPKPRPMMSDDELLAGMDPVEGRETGEREGHVSVKFGSAAPSAKILRTETAANLFRTTKAPTATLAGKLFPLIRMRLSHIVGDVKVHFVDAAEVQRLALDADPTAFGAQGFYKPKWGGEGGYIILADNIPADRLAHIFTHEALHAATEDALRAHDQFRGQVTAIMDEVKAAHPDLKRYGFTNESEFIAEAFSNPTFQELLASTPVSEKLAKSLGLERRSLWSALVDAIRSVLRLPSHSALEALVKPTNDLMTMTGRMNDLERLNRQQPQARFHLEDAMRPPKGEKLDHLFRETFRDGAERSFKQLADNLVSKPVDTIVSTVKDLAKNPNVGTKLRELGRRLTPNDQYRQNIEHLFERTGRENVVRQVFDLVEKQGVRATNLKKEGDDVVTAMMRAQKINPGAFDKFADLVNDATMYGVDPSAALGEGRNKHLDAKGRGHEAPMGQWEALKNHPELSRQYKELVRQNPDFAPLMKRTFDYFDEVQDAMARNHIENLVRADESFTGDIKSHVEELLAAKVNEEWQDKIDALHGQAIREEIEKAKELSGRDGPYAPLMRHGDWAIVGKYKIKEPTNAINKIGDDIYEFATREEAHDFANSVGLYTRTKTAYYDLETGERTGKVAGTSTEGTPEQRFQVQVNRKHVEFHEDRNSAAKRRQQLHESGEFAELSPELSREQNEGSFNELTSAGMQTVLRRLEQTDEYKRASASQKRDMRNALREGSLALQAGNRVQSRRLPRRNVAGASNDLARNLFEYNQSQANYRAKQEFRPQIDEALMKMKREEQRRRYDKDATERSIAVNEIANRARAQDPNEYSGAYTDWTRRLSTWSYIDRMMRPSHLILHQTHLPMITAPYIGGRHGHMQAQKTIAATWRQAFSAYKAGGEDFVSSLGDALHKGTDFDTLMKKALASGDDATRINRLIDELSEIGLIHPQAGQEVGKYIPHKQLGGVTGALDYGINRMDTVFRHLTNATEAINRYVGATAAYRLEYARQMREGAGAAKAHDLAVDYARDTLSNTQGFYSSTNAAPLFKNRVLRPFLQFRQFPLMMYHLLGRVTTQAFKGATTKEKIEGVKALAGILATHSLMTGALGGLPLEAFKVVGSVSKGMGLTDSDWSDFERAEYDAAVQMFGKDGADLVMHGLSRQLGFDAHHRLGLNSFVTFGLPEKLDAKSAWGYLGQQAAGAPGGLVGDAFSGIRKMAEGDIAGGLAKAFPLQVLRDVQKAWGGGPKEAPYSAKDTVTRLLGFTPASEAETFERRAETQTLKDEYQKNRSRLMYRWMDAEPGDRSTIWSEIMKWNSTLPTESRITYDQLVKAQTRRKKGEDTGQIINGVYLGKRMKFIGDRARAIY